MISHRSPILAPPSLLVEPKSPPHQVLLAHGARPTASVNGGFTPLHVAAQSDRWSVARELIAGGCPLNVPNTAGVVPLAVAAEAGHAEVAVGLLDAGADPEVVDHDLSTPLHCAIHSDSFPIVRRLLEAGADPCVEDKNHDFPLLAAANRGLVDIVLCLVAAGAPVGQGTSDMGFTALHGSAEMGRTEVVKELLRLNARHDQVRMCLFLFVGCCLVRLVENEFTP